MTAATLELTEAGRDWAQAHRGTSIVASVALDGEGWPDHFRDTAIRACNHAAEPKPRHGMIRRARYVQSSRRKLNRRPFPLDGVCPGCGCEEWKNVEEGYSRWSQAEWETLEVPADSGATSQLVVSHDGWDDMSEGGDDEYVMCDYCERQYDLPEEVDHR